MLPISKSFCFLWGAFSIKLNPIKIDPPGLRGCGMIYMGGVLQWHLFGCKNEAKEASTSILKQTQQLLQQLSKVWKNIVRLRMYQVFLPEPTQLSDMN